MAHLITHHDPFHIHKLLGLLVLLHYIYRFYLVFQTGTAFPSAESSTSAIGGILLHGLLSWSSLLLPLPTRRNFAKPMIWPEFRLHSILFASRHVLSATLSRANLWPDDNATFGNAFVRAAIVLGTVHIAKVITNKFGSNVKRTTNSMPYPEHVTPQQQLAIKRLYTTAQFGATVTCFINDASTNFAPLLGIQMAPLLMTLVRKGKISTGMYHRVYATSLSLGYLMIFSRLYMLFQNKEDVNNVDYYYYDNNNTTTSSNNSNMHTDVDTVAYTFRALVLFSLPFSRSRNYISAKTFWMGTIVLATIVYPNVMHYFFSEIRENYDGLAIMPRNRHSISLITHLLRKIVTLFSVVTMTKHICTYSPLFGTTTCSTSTTAASANLTISAEKSRNKSGLVVESMMDLIWRFLRNDFGTVPR